jgi:lipopolysaccharide transport system permease protein
MAIAEHEQGVDELAQGVAAASGAPGTSLTVMEPTRGWASPRFHELWQYRELLYFLSWRDIKVRYNQTVVGVVWAVFQPIMTVVVFTILLGHLGKFPSRHVPYAVLVFSGMLPWTLFANALTQASASLVGNQQLVTKIYVPRLILPLASMVSTLIDFALGFVVFLAVMAWYGVIPPIAILALPLLVALTLVTALSIGLWLSALNVRYRDVQYALPFLTQMWFFLTPVAYTTALIPEKWRLVYGINPMAGIVEGFRWALIGDAPTVGPLLALSGGLVAVLLVGGVAYFRRVEKSFADVI